MIKTSQIEKALGSGGPDQKRMDMKQFIKTADREKVDANIMQNLAATIKKDFGKEKKKGQKFIDWLQSQPDSYFIRIKLNSGGKVVSLRDYMKSKEPKIKKINLADYFEFGRTVSSLTDAEKKVVADLLNKSFGKDK